MTLPNGIVRRGLALAALFILGLDAAVPAAHAADAATVGAVVVRFRGEAIPRDATALPPAFADELAKAMRVGVVERGRTRDGAFRLSLEPPLPFVEARDAITRVRLRDDILYASLAPTRDPVALPRVQPKAGTPEPLLHRLIVKYRDPGLEQAAVAQPAARTEPARPHRDAGGTAGRARARDVRATPTSSACSTGYPARKSRRSPTYSRRTRRWSGRSPITSTRSRSHPTTRATRASGTTSRPQAA